MIPYFPPPVFWIGLVPIHGFGILVGAALLTGYGIALRMSRARSLDPDCTGWMYAGSLLVGLFAGYAVGNPGVSSWGAAVGGVSAVAGAGLLYQGRAALPYLDVLAFAFPFTYALARAGCFLAHDHVGARSSHWLAVQFPGGSRFDLGLLECLAALGVGLVGVALRRWRLTPGVLAALLALFCIVGKLSIWRVAGGETAQHEQAQALGQPVEYPHHSPRKPAVK
jgi:phosphatidylglycerol:prolipoprotein diacylglycerol transferase